LSHPRPSPTGSNPQGRRSRVAPLFRALALCAVAALPCCTLITPARAQLNPTEPDPQRAGLDVVERLGDKLPLDLDFVASDGRPVKLGDYFNTKNAAGTLKPVVIALVYHRCPVSCPAILTKLHYRLNELDLTVGEQFNVLVVSFDPTDKPPASAALKREAISTYRNNTAPGIQQSWEFLTSPTTSAQVLADKLGFGYRFLPESGEYAHAAAIFVATPEGTISRYLYGVDYPPRQLKLALMEAADGRIGNSFERFLQWCYHWDPKTGQYSLSAFRVMQVGAGASTLLVGGLVGGLWYKDRARRRANGNLPSRTEPSGRRGPGTINSGARTLPQ
jgi:protein SCO1/2